MSPLSPQSYYQTICLAASGDNAAANNLRKSIRSMARAVGCDARDIDEVVHESETKVLLGYKKIMERNAAYSWSHQVVTRTHLAHLRREATWRGKVVLASELEDSLRRTGNDDMSADYSALGRNDCADDASELAELTEAKTTLTRKAAVDGVCAIVLYWSRKVAMNSDQIVRLAYAVSTLSLYHRVVLLTLLHFTKIKDAAAYLNMPEKTLYGIRLKILEKLREAGLSDRIIGELMLRIGLIVFPISDDLAIHRDVPTHVDQRIAREQSLLEFMTPSLN
jgi:DNA-directed RNA polymerase specialized sigma24 family protein